MRTMNFQVFFVVLLLFVAGFAPQDANATKQDECAIWLCLPGKFPMGCAAAQAAMVRRLADFKPALPSFGTCSEDGNAGGMSHAEGRAAYIPAGRICKSYKWVADSGRYRNGYSGDNESSTRVCTQWQTIPEQYLKNKRCRTWSNEGETHSSPSNCTKTVRFVEVYSEGKLAGPPYYW